MTKPQTDSAPKTTPAYEASQFTIGIIGMSPQSVAKLNEEIVKYGNSVGFDEDQKHPEILAIGSTTLDINYLWDQAKLCSDFGCDILAIASTPGDTEIMRRFSKELSVVPMALENESDAAFKLLAQQIIDSIMSRAESGLKPRRSQNRSAQFPDYESKLDLDARERQARMDFRASHGSYPLFTAPQSPLCGKFIGVIGGAGPLASAEASKKLAREGLSFIHWSVNQAPGKLKHEMGEGPDYVHYYKHASKFLKKLLTGDTIIPCNTAHKRLEEFESKLNIFDIRTGVLEAMQQKLEPTILLGTNTTTGVGAKSVGTYERLRKSKYPNCPDFILPSPEQQAIINQAIFEVKSGDLDGAKKKILSVTQEIRKNHPGAEVVLACTELPLPFTEMELSENRFLDPVALTVQKLGALKRITSQRSSSSHSSDDEERTNDSRLSRAKRIHLLGTQATSSRLSYDVSDDEKPSSNEFFIEHLKNLRTNYNITVFNSERGTFRIQFRKKNAQSPHIDNFRESMLGILSYFKGSDDDRIHYNLDETCHISFHKPLQKLQEWIKENNINIESGLPSSSLKPTPQASQLAGSSSEHQRS